MARPGATVSSRTPVRSGIARTAGLALALTLLSVAGAAPVLGAETAMGQGPVLAPRTVLGQDDRPDIVMIMVDDLPAMDERVLERLPNIKQTFLDEGTRFTNFYVESPLCCPGRAGWLTGLHTKNHHVTINDVNQFDPATTVATELEDVGYETALVGKYFNGYWEVARIVPPGWTHFHGLSGAYYDYGIWNDGVRERHGSAPDDYSTDVIRDKAILRLDVASPDKRILLWITPRPPHWPLLAAPRHRDDPRCNGIDPWKPANWQEADVSDKPAYIRRLSRGSGDGYPSATNCRMMLAVDDLVGAVRDKLQSLGRLQNTILMLTSDHGMNAGAHRLSSKGSPYATQTHFYVRWESGLGTQRRAIDDVVTNIDLAPTLCLIAECTMGPYPNGQQTADGRSFARVLLGKDASMGRDAILESMPAGFSGIPAWFAVRTSADSPLAATRCAAAPQNGCRWHYVEYGTGERELYDVSNGPCHLWYRGDPGDPCELHNRSGAQSFAAVEAVLATRLRQLKHEHGT